MSDVLVGEQDGRPELLSVDRLRVVLAGSETDVVDDVSFALGAGEVLGLVGESGSGKTTVALALMGWARRGLRIASGSVRLDGEEVIGQGQRDLRRLRGASVAYVAQDPTSALNPALKVGTQLREIFAAEPKRVLESVHKEMGGQLRYVISSSWRHVFSRAQIERVFRTADVGFVAVGLHEKWETPSRLPGTDRIEEIESWLHHYHQGEPFVVLDDDYSGTSLSGIDEDLKHPLAARVVLCPVGVGLTVEHSPIILDALRRPFAGEFARAR